MAMPTSAAASAGASLIPSPAIATRRPFACAARSTFACFWSGRTSAIDFVDARARRATASAVRAVVAGQHDDADALAREARRSLPRRGLLDRVGDDEEPGEPAVDRDEHDALAFAARCASACASSAPGSIPSSRISAALPSATLRPSTVPGDALAGARCEVARLAGRSRPRSSAPSTIAAASGCSLPRSSAAASRSSSSSSKPSAGYDRDQLRLASGQRAGLVDDQRVDLLHQLERLGVLDQHAGAARRGRCRP